MLGVLVAVTVVHGPPATGAGRLAALSAAGLASGSALSMTWAESVERAWAEIDRWILYAAIARHRRRRGANRRRRSTNDDRRRRDGRCRRRDHRSRRRSAAPNQLFFDYRLQAPLGYVNGAAGLFLMGLWPLLALAAHQRRATGGLRRRPRCAPHLRRTCSSSPSPRALLARARRVRRLVLTVVPDRLPRVHALLVVATAVVAASPGRSTSTTRRPQPREPRPQRSLITTAAVAMSWRPRSAPPLYGRLSSRCVGGRLARPVAARARDAALVAIVTGPLAPSATPCQRSCERWDDFTALTIDENDGASRFTDAGGFRYDLWRIAWDDFKADPLHGLGAGNYGLTYFQKRRTTEPVRQPHSIELQLLGETGLPGLLLFVGLLARPAGGWRALRDGRM